ncbi:uncharacterized protein LOC123407874 [Hordeum vulgare subsp. vulgare]|uniref:Rx N-terminal domain-containing protein n=1 Tax=Hordeum vulgare subsp. vulgare TaxID=112509 RepID=A0A8I6YD21_HORVV|nr:uncharacterized protein LOC123407874 [Hordeum vulgare subsp. vulgare]
MEVAVSAVASEVAGRLVSFLIGKYRGQARPSKKENLESLRRLLLRVHTVIEEAGGRYIANSRMLLQLQALTEAMYRGYDALDTHAPLEQIGAQPEASGSVDFTSFNRAAASKEVQAALRALETASAEMAEFIALLAGCERMIRSPYSCYLHIDNFMFGRRVERQRVINILMQDEDGHPPLGAPTVLPIIGGRRVGKKTLVWSVCSDDRIRSRFPSILHVDGCEIQRIGRDRFTTPPVRTLIVVEFRSDVELDDREWHGFLSLLRALTGVGSKVVIVSRLEALARFGTVDLVRINSFSREEYGYLFKVLAFGSSDPADHPRLALIGKELAALMEGSLVHLNVYSSVLRNNLNVRFWSRALKLYRTVMEANLSVFGEHPRALLDRGGTVDITRFSPSGATSLRFTLLIGASGRDSSGPGELPRMTFGDIIAGSVLLPMKFELVWESRLPPYTVISGTCVADKPQQSASLRKKRRT